MSKAADEYEDIARRLKELEADRQLALTGSSAPVQVEAPKDINWDSYGYPIGYTPSGFNEAARQYMAGNLSNIVNGNLSSFNLPDLRGRIKASG